MTVNITDKQAWIMRRCRELESIYAAQPVNDALLENILYRARLEAELREQKGEPYNEPASLRD